MNLRSLRLAPFALLAVACASHVDPAPESVDTAADPLVTANLVADPSFEAQTGASLGGAWQGAAVVESGTQARGARAVRAQADGGWNPVQQWVKVKPFTHYVASVAVESSDNLSDAYFSVRSGATWNVLNQVPFGAVGAGAYRTLRFEFDTGNDGSVLLYVGFWAHAPATWLRIDDVNVREAPNAVANGAFEGSTSGWQITGAGTLDASRPHTGTDALVLRGTSGWTSANRWIPVAKNTRYRVGGWMRSTPTPIDGWFSVRGAVDGAVINQVHYGTLADDYQWQSFEFDSGPNTSVLLYAGFWGQGVASSVEIDDVTMTNAAPLHGTYGVGNYGFLSTYDCAESEAAARAKIDTMVSRFHVTDVQFYDWMASYDSATSGSQWTDAFFHQSTICRQTIGWYVDELHRQGARAWAYVQSVAAERRDLADGAGIAAWTNAAGQPICMRAPSGFAGACTGDGQYPIYVPDAAWADHQVAVWGASVAALGFDGIHWDTLGTLGGSAAQQAPGIQAFLAEAATQLAPYHLMQTMNFVSMNWWAPSVLDAIAFTYAEAWSAGDRDALYAKMSAPGMLDRGAVLPFYTYVHDDGTRDSWTCNAPLDPAQADARLLSRWSDAARRGVRYLVPGDGASYLVNEYFPCRAPLSANAAYQLSQ